MAAALLIAMAALPAVRSARGQDAWRPADQDVQAILAGAPQLRVEDVCSPVRSAVFFPGNITWVPNPDGRTYDVVIPYEQRYGGPASVAIIDLGTGKVQVQSHPRGVGWHIVGWVLAPDGKCYLSQLNYTRRLNVEISVYDPAKDELTVRAFPTPDTIRGETHPIAVGTDGKIYLGGSHPTAAVTAIMLDPATGEVTDFGAAGPTHPGGCWAGGIGADATHVYIASGRVPWYLIAIDKKTKEANVLATTDTVGGSVGVSQGEFGVTATVVQGTGKPRQEFWCRQGRIMPRDQPRPWQEGPSARAALGRIYQENGPQGLTTYIENVAPASDGACELWVRAEVPGAIKDPAAPGWSGIRYQVETYPQAIERIIETFGGRIFGTGGNYSGHFVYDPAADRHEYLGKTALSHYATLAVGSKIYMSGYPSAPVIVYDAAKPWTLTAGAGPGTRRTAMDSPQSNPRSLGYLRESRCHKMYAAALGASGRVYFGGQWIRDGDCGGIGWWDPVAEQRGGFWEIFSNQQVCFMTAAADGKLIVISTLRRADPILNKPTPNEGKLFVLDDATKEIVREITVVEGVRGPGPVAPAGGHRVIGWTNDPVDEAGRSVLYGVDVEKGQVVWKKTLPVPLPVRVGSNQMEPWDWRIGPDGFIWTYMGTGQNYALVRIDPRDASIRAVGRFSPGGRLAFAPPDIYLAGATTLRRVKGVVKAGE